MYFDVLFNFFLFKFGNKKNRRKKQAKVRQYIANLKIFDN